MARKRIVTDKDTADILKRLDTPQARKAGWSVEFLRGSGHYRVKRHGVFVTTFPGSASDWRSIRNGKAALKRAGFRA